MSKTSIIESQTAILTALRDEAAKAGDQTQVELCDAAMGGDWDAYCECIRVIVEDGGHASSNWTLRDEDGDSVYTPEADQAILESLTCGTDEGWVTLSDGRRVYAS